MGVAWADSVSPPPVSRTLVSFTLVLESPGLLSGNIESRHGHPSSRPAERRLGGGLGSWGRREQREWGQGGTPRKGSFPKGTGEEATARRPLLLTSFKISP